jgi:hypothetical protein
VAPAVSYTCSAWVSREGAGIDGVGLGIRWFNKSGYRVADSVGWFSGSSAAWEPLSYTCISPDNAYSCIVSCILAASDPCTVWIDDVQLYEALKWKTYYPDTIKIVIGTVDTIDMELFEADDGQYQTIAAETSEGDWWTDWYGEFQISEDEEYVKRLWVGYDGHYGVGERNQKIYLWNFDPDSLKWCLLCATDTSGSCINKVRQADITHGWSTANTDSIQDYIDQNGFIRLRVMAKDPSSTFNCLADYMRISVQYESQ